MKLHDLKEQLIKAKLAASSLASALWYALPDPRFSVEVPTSDASRWLADLRRDGVVRIEAEKFRKIADYLEKNYFLPLEGGHPLSQRGFAVDTNFPLFREYGTELLREISFADPGLTPFFIDSEISAVCCSYYRRQAYYRNQPVIQKLSHRKDQNPALGNAFHVDHFRQLSLMLLVSDQTVTETHMEYVVGSHRRLRFSPGPLRAEEVAREVAPERVFPCIGKKGTLFLFDAGGVHRRNLKAETSRRIFHCNITAGSNLKPFKESLRDWSALNACPRSTRRMFQKVRL